MASTSAATWQQAVTVNSRLLDDFLEELAAEERVLLQRSRNLEEQRVREAILGKKPLPVPVPEWEEDDELDLTTLPRYEEYR